MAQHSINTTVGLWYTAHSIFVFTRDKNSNPWAEHLHSSELTLKNPLHESPVSYAPLIRQVDLTVCQDLYTAQYVMQIPVIPLPQLIYMAKICTQVKWQSKTHILLTAMAFWQHWWLLWLVLFTDSHWETDKCPLFIHNIASSHKYKCWSNIPFVKTWLYPEINRTPGHRHMFVQTNSARI